MIRYFSLNNEEIDSPIRVFTQFDYHATMYIDRLSRNAILGDGVKRMSNLINKFSQFFGSRDLSAYPELFDKKENTDLSYKLVTASNSVFYDTAVHTSTINWKEI
jgi:hypothetical protein